jgi:hypothetical protein
LKPLILKYCSSFTAYKTDFKIIRDPFGSFGCLGFARLVWYKLVGFLGLFAFGGKWMVFVKLLVNEIYLDFGFRVKWRVKWRVAKGHVRIMVGFVLYAWIRLCFRKLLLLKVASMRTG